MSTHEPRPPYSDAELAVLYPPHLRLQLVQILLRHGERSPVSPRFVNAGVPPFWPYCSAVRHLRSAVLDPGDPRSSFSTLEWKRRLETFGAADDSPVVAAGPAGELDAICDMGMLTDRGRETTLRLGQRLRRLYVQQLGFLPAGIKDTDFIYLRATPIPRALESMQQTLLGLYPSHTRDPDLPPPTILSRAPADETLFPNDGNCRRFAALARAFAQRAADRWNDSGEMAYLTKKLGKWMPDDSPKVAVDSRPRLSGIMDTINATSAHGPQTKLPSEFYDPKVKQIIEKIGVEEWYAGYKESQEYRTLGIGALLGDVVSRMVGSAEQSPADGAQEVTRKAGAGAVPIRLGLSGCHDTTLAATLASLGAFETDNWPPFTSHVAIELFRRADEPNPSSARSWWPSLLGGAASPPAIGRKPTTNLSDAQRQAIQGYYVRIRYNDVPVTVPGCRAPGKHLDGDESFCTLEAFKAIVDKFTPQNWKQQCRTGVKLPAFPPRPEPAGY
ncbi:histidine phosphatase superfamily (branch 2) domain-containing protein [Hirsutella rhossiliensis]|uniref:3-phytase n=1 Tax=Hirsutella rhossiliensis TaxID=111463 RepID=A0A9P8MUC0_9HYPO|nr:histidine phosphatase superfamily (branch 2) domain-containing protein [Hirsutella rhossiliensis]KAH0960584.1 histidine phosphatase superfamily (branch 2) domain-containing protein [Hirsutella rhossiliensis]